MHGPPSLMLSATCTTLHMCLWLELPLTLEPVQRVGKRERVFNVHAPSLVGMHPGVHDACTSFDMNPGVDGACIRRCPPPLCLLAAYMHLSLHHLPIHGERVCERERELMMLLFVMSCP